MRSLRIPVSSGRGVCQEILIVNDGSTDHMLPLITETYALEPAFHLNPNHLKTAPIREVYRSKTHPHIWVIDKKTKAKQTPLTRPLTIVRLLSFASWMPTPFLSPTP